ncbi:hypothetical protein HDF18_10805 [Mucilaginibacter sp. X5P1]|uniref:hypothetical protein n=1 Tax=Mucilaginibacter sp. X5P1 TaxID=2723088 RepID=UPI0016175B1B|nr:hypothetical protein [Mucilaginibacter sp. X5P1]MBB6140687.1 hypothetical protein [Mucilaginibacter sp. X5P1]
MEGIVIYRLDILKRTAIFGAIAVLVMVIFSIRGHYADLNYQFNGVVDSVIYDKNDIKGFADVTIKGKTFSLYNGGWTFNHQIKKGDLLIKERKSMIIKLIKPNGEILIGNGD